MPTRPHACRLNGEYSFPIAKLSRPQFAAVFPQNRHTPGFSDTINEKQLLPTESAFICGAWQGKRNDKLQPDCRARSDHAKLVGPDSRSDTRGLFKSEMGPANEVRTARPALTKHLLTICKSCGTRSSTEPLASTSSSTFSHRSSESSNWTKWL